MNNKNTWSIVGVILAAIVLLFGNNIYSQFMGRSFFSPENLINIFPALVVIVILIGTGIILYKRSNAFILDTTKSFISGSWTDEGVWVHINGFIFYVTNRSNKPIIEVSGFLRSNITNQTYPIYLCDFDGNFILPSESNGIPPRSKDIPIFAAFVFDENGKPDKNHGVSPNTILSTVADTTLVLSLDGKSFQYHIRESKIRAGLEAIRKNINPSALPSVTRKNNSPK